MSTMEAEDERTTDSQSEQRIRLEIVKEPSTEKQERILEALTHVSEDVHENSVLEYKEELVRLTKEYLREEYDVDQQSSYIWQILARFTTTHVLDESPSSEPTLEVTDDGDFRVHIDDESMNLDTFKRIYSMAKGV